MASPPQHLPQRTSIPPWMERGVGLAAARGAHRAIGGELELESIDGVGTVVRAKMPLAPAIRSGSHAPLRRAI